LIFEMSSPDANNSSGENSDVCNDVDDDGV
jgi:hypothetical protein